MHFGIAKKFLNHTKMEFWGVIKRCNHTKTDFREVAERRNHGKMNFGMEGSLLKITKMHFCGA